MEWKRKMTSIEFKNQVGVCVCMALLWFSAAALPIVSVRRSRIHLFPIYLLGSY